MKKMFSLTVLISLVLIIGLAVVGCGKGGSPSSVTRQLYAAIEKGDAKTIGELMTPEAAQMLVMFLEKAKGMVIAKGGITKTEETINGDNAVVTTTFKDGTTEELDLVKIDGKWKVNMEK